MSKAMSANKSSPPLLYFDFLAPKDITDPTQGQVLLTFRGNVFRLANGELSFGVPIFARIRNVDGSEVSTTEQVAWMAYGLQWAGQYLLAFLTALERNAIDYSELILAAPADFEPAITTRSLLKTAFNPQVQLVPRTLWTEGSGYNAKTHVRS